MSIISWNRKLQLIRTLNVVINGQRKHIHVHVVFHSPIIITLISMIDIELLSKDFVIELSDLILTLIVMFGTK